MNTLPSPAVAAAQEAPTSAPRRRSIFQWIGACLAIGAGLILLYALSFGPAIRMNKEGKIRPETIESVYLPLFLLVDALGADSVLEAYVLLWVDPTPPA